MSSVQAINNLNLTCISVDDVQFSVFNWTNPFWFGFDSQHYFSNNCSETVSILDEPVPLSIRLKPNYPNPFNPVTTLRYDIPENAFVNIRVYDLNQDKIKKESINIMINVEDVYRQILKRFI